MNSEWTTCFRFDVSTSELHFNVFDDKTERERENTSSSHEMKQKRENRWHSFFRSLLLSTKLCVDLFFLLTIQVTHYRMGHLSEKKKNEQQQQRQIKKSRKKTSNILYKYAHFLQLLNNVRYGYEQQTIEYGTTSTTQHSNGAKLPSSMARWKYRRR